MISLRLPEELIEAAARWASRQSDRTESCSEAIRRLVELGLKAKPTRSSMPAWLSFREYVLKRGMRYTPASRFVNSAMQDEKFLAIKSREDLDEYMGTHKVAANERSYADAVWSSYLKMRKTAQSRG